MSNTGYAYQLDVNIVEQQITLHKLLWMHMQNSDTIWFIICKQQTMDRRAIFDFLQTCGSMEVITNTTNNKLIILICDMLNLG